MVFYRRKSTEKHSHGNPTLRVLYCTSSTPGYVLYSSTSSMYFRCDTLRLSYMLLVNRRPHRALYSEGTPGECHVVSTLGTISSILLVGSTQWTTCRPQIVCRQSTYTPPPSYGPMDMAPSKTLYMVQFLMLLAVFVSSHVHTPYKKGRPAGLLTELLIIMPC